MKDLMAQFDQLLAATRDAAKQAGTFYKGLRGEGVPRGDAGVVTAAYVQAMIAVSVQGSGDAEESP